MPSGGTRPGAGRPRGSTKKAKPTAATAAPATPATGAHYETAEDYLTAVVQGTEPPDALRLTAAKALIAYQAARKRAPVASPAPRALAKQAVKYEGDTVNDEYQQKAAIIRLKHTKKGSRP